MTTSPSHEAYICGLDVHKHTHQACVLDRDGAVVAAGQAFANDRAGYQTLLRRLDAIAPPARFLVAMEATGHYWYGLHDFLQRHGYRVVVLNPIQTAQQAKKGIRKTTTDRIAARDIAQLVCNGEHRPAHIPGPLAMTCRQVTRLRYALLGQELRLRQLLRSRLHPVWPEYETYFADPFCATSRALLAVAPTPEDLRALDDDQLTRLLWRTSRGKLGADRAQTIRDSAAHSVGMQRGLPGTRLCLQTLLRQFEAAGRIRNDLEDQIATLGQQLPDYLHTLPGATPLWTVSLYGEIDPVDTFTRPRQLVAFAGLDPAVRESGQRRGGPRRLSKRGSPYLRRTLWMMAHRATYHEGDLRTFFLRKRTAGLHHLAAVTATAVKLCHVVWRILTDQRPYLPSPPDPQT